MNWHTATNLKWKREKALTFSRIEVSWWIMMDEYSRKHSTMGWWNIAGVQRPIIGYPRSLFEIAKLQIG